MTYRRLAPDPRLRGIVEGIWIQEAPDAARGPVRPVLPTGTVEILFHYRDPMVHLEASGERTLPRSYVTGQRTRPVLPAGTGDIGIVLVSLFPWALPCLFRQPPADLVDGYTDVGLLLPPGHLHRLEERLARCRASRRVGLVQAFLLGLLNGASPDARVRLAAERLAGHDAPLGIHGVARELGWSCRTLRRRFQAEVGIPPKTFQRIMRFQRALRLRRTGSGWPAVAAHCGYSDQAHLIREVKEFSGRTPGQVPWDFERPLDLFNARDVSRFFSTVYL
jgi:AraC-like DNA-binding protein